MPVSSMEPPSTEVRCATVSIEEAATVLGISRALGYESARRGDIPVIRIGRRLVVPKDRLEALLAGEASETARQPIEVA